MVTLIDDTVEHSLSLSSQHLLHDAVMCPPHSCVHFELQVSRQLLHPVNWMTNICTWHTMTAYLF